MGAIGKQDVVIWAGPVNASQVPGATIPGAREVFFTCVGDIQPGKAYCSSVADTWLDGSGRRLPTILKRLGLSEETAGRIVLGAFSAGGIALKRLISHPADRARITAMLLADASYSAGGSPANPLPIEEYATFALDAMRDPKKLFVATASASPNKEWGSGSQVLNATRKLIEQRSGEVFERGGTLPLNDQPVDLYRSKNGNVIFADYGLKGGGHGYHPQLAPQVWQRILWPWLERGGASSSWPVPWWLTFAAGSALGYSGLMLYQRRVV